ncbi:MAG: hypothetical protein AAFU79_19475 [Myxococcota bacterium]
MATLHARMFIAQATLEGWMDTGRAVLEADRVQLRAGWVYRIEPAVRFTAVVSAPSDVDLLGKVLSESRVVELGGELLGDSVLFGDAAFQVESGYIGTLETPSPDRAQTEST